MQKVIDWQIIETAPKDGTFVLLGGGEWEDDFTDNMKCIQVGRWRHDTWTTFVGYAGGFDGGLAVSEYREPTHWASLNELAPT